MNSGTRLLLHYSNILVPIIHKACIPFRTDMIDLYKQFGKFSPSELIGIGNDLSPHYYGMTQQFRDKNPETKIGTPGRYQVVPTLLVGNTSLFYLFSRASTAG